MSARGEEAAGEASGSQEQPEPEPTPPEPKKRGPGRPRKPQQEPTGEPVPKRPRGRPKGSKNKGPSKAAQKKAETTGEKRPRGRPRKWVRRWTGSPVPSGQAALCCGGGGVLERTISVLRRLTLFSCALQSPFILPAGRCPACLCVWFLCRRDHGGERRSSCALSRPALHKC
ncbi:uncharacterized protein LOC122139801 isoform X1 [Cyprinus carpio]|uniref:Methionine sulfoxide reductase B3 n=1 Tax=Cyprinus carpio TaxID=7962 RepID=A0A8C1VZU2_CYPCA|nr:uncharacterized protein LOC122139801 isoform X1 [Cyprinus carpio]